MRVQSLAGSTLAEISPLPQNVTELKNILHERLGVAPGLQKFVLGSTILGTGGIDEELPVEDGGQLDLTFLVDESAFFEWDFAANPCRNLLCGEGAEVIFKQESVDYVNVVTQEPIQGKHYFQFIMHVVGDEQWSGLALDRNRAGYQSVSKNGYFYYSGRRFARSQGALHAPAEYKEVAKCARMKSGDVLGVLIDTDAGALVFLLNDEVQVACAIPSRSFYLSTSLDRAEDHVELRKLIFDDAPASAHEALRGALLQPAPSDNLRAHSETSSSSGRVPIFGSDDTESQASSDTVQSQGGAAPAGVDIAVAMDGNAAVASVPTAPILQEPNRQRSRWAWLNTCFASMRCCPCMGRID